VIDCSTCEGATTVRLVGERSTAAFCLSYENETAEVVGPTDSTTVGLDWRETGSSSKSFTYGRVDQTPDCQQDTQLDLISLDPDEFACRDVRVRTPDFEEVVEDFHAPLFCFGLALCGSETHAATLTQRAFDRWATRGHLRAGFDGDKPKIWLFASMYREFQAAIQDRNGIAPDQLPEPAGGGMRAATGIVDQLDAIVVQKALFHLEEPFRAAVVLFYMQRHSCNEIALILRVPVDIVMARIRHGKSQLRVSLAGRHCSKPCESF
jgi:DNA-directed RNA polymerase specialized sigma24 family protein